MFKRLLERLRRAVAAVPPEVTERLKRIDAWLAHLPADQARVEAMRVITNPEWFTLTPGPPPGPLPDWLPASLRELFMRFVKVEGRYCDFVIDGTSVHESRTERPLLQIGWFDEHVELCVSPVDGRVYALADDVPGDESREGSHATIYHAILSVAAVLHYVDPAPAA